MATRYYKATAKNGRVHTRCTDTKVYTRAFIPDSGGRANWASAGYTPVEARQKVGELVDAVEIDAAEYRALKKAARA